MRKKERRQKRKRKEKGKGRVEGKIELDTVITQWETTTNMEGVISKFNRTCFKQLYPLNPAGDQTKGH